MYENENEYGSGVFSGGSGRINPTEKNTIDTTADAAMGTATDTAMGTATCTTNRYDGYATYQTGNAGVFSGGVQSNFEREGRSYSGHDSRSSSWHDSRSHSEGDNGKRSAEKNPKGGGVFRKALLSISLGLFFGLFAGIGFYAVQQVMDVIQPANNNNAVPESAGSIPADFDNGSDIKLTNTNNITVVESDVSDMVEEVMPAMVSIINNYTETLSFFGQTFTQEQPSSGSGIIVQQNDNELLIVSNYHVIADATSLEVTFIDGTTAQAKVKGTDSDMDLAVIAIPLKDISKETKDAISVATLGDSDKLRMGEPVVAIGNALGYGQSVTNGIVSALNREITMSDGSTGTFIQTNAEINPGNSGGALLNINGEVIGINSSKIGGDAIEGMGYAIPISSASPIIADLMERQTREKVEDDEKGYIGITFQNVTEQHHQMYNMPIGIFVYEVSEASAAEKAGILPGDIITKFDGERVSSNADLQDVLQYYRVGDSARITIMRLENGEYTEHEMDITLGAKPENAQ